MSQVFMRCPNTGKPLYVGLSLEWGELEALEPASVNRKVPCCPHCGRAHRFANEDLFLRADGGGD